MITKVVIPIAGFGTRMFPASKTEPKALFPILDPESGQQVPVLHWIIQYTLDSLARYYFIRKQGVDGDLSQTQQFYQHFQVCIVLNESQREVVQGYFEADNVHNVYKNSAVCKPMLEKLSALSKQLTFVLQHEPAGYGDAILCAKEFVNNQPFLILIGDHVYTSSHKDGHSVVEQMVAAYEHHCDNKTSELSPFRSLTSLDTCVHSTLSVNGILKMSDSITESIGQLENGIVALQTTIEKPTPQQASEAKLALNASQIDQLKMTLPQQNSNNEPVYLCYFGIEILSPSIFAHIEKLKRTVWQVQRKEVQLRDPMRELIHDLANEGMLGLVVRGKRHDTGLPLAYAESMHAMLMDYQSHHK